MPDLRKDEDGFYGGAPGSGPDVNDLTDKLGGLLTETEEDKPKPTGLLHSTHEVTVTLADQQADPNSPLFSVKEFSELGLHEDLLKGIYAMGFTKPSKIQERALPLMLSSPPKNMIGQSQSGTGKTAAFVLTMLSRIDYSQQATQAICLAPSRELARQIMDVVVQMSKYTKLTTGFAIKDTPPSDPNRPPHLVVGTPGTMFDMIQKRKTIKTEHVKVFVLDEADNMLDQRSLGDQTLRVKNLIPRTAQNILFSATFPPLVRTFASKFAPGANEIKLKQEELSVEGIKQFYMDCKDEATKFDVLVELYSLMTIGQSIIFCKRRDTADQIAARMTAQGHQVTSHHGQKDSADRDATIDDFREGKSKVLITTNVLARGLDILQVNMVVNYDMPLDGEGKPDAETYLHRIGRTGRFGRKGVSINFVHDRRSWEEMHTIETELKHAILRVKTDDFDAMEKILKDALKS